MEKKYIINDGEDGIFDTLEEAVMAWVDYIGGHISEIEIYEAEVEPYTIENTLGKYIGTDVLEFTDQGIYTEMYSEFEGSAFEGLSVEKLQEFHDFIYKFVDDNSTLHQHFKLKDKKLLTITKEMLINIFGEEDYNEMCLTEEDL